MSSSECVREGLIIAGGRSTRFGDTDKAVAPLHGVPMIRRVADRIAPVIDQLAINCREAQRSSIATALDGYEHPCAIRVDEIPDRGPLGGFETGLAGTDADWAFVIACDMPYVQAPVVEMLFTQAQNSEAAVPRPDEWYEPLHAVYHPTSMRHACREALAAGEDRIVHALNRIDFVTIGASTITAVGSLNTFENVNTPAEFVTAEDWFAKK